MTGSATKLSTLLPGIASLDAMKSEIAQTRKQRQAEQRDRAEDEAEREGPEPAAARFFDHDRLGYQGRSQRMFTLDHAARDIVGDGVDDNGDIVGLGKHDAA